MSGTEIEKLCAELNEVIKGKPIDTVLTALLCMTGFAMKQGALNLEQAHKIISEIHQNSQIVRDKGVSLH